MWTNRTLPLLLALAGCAPDEPKGGGNEATCGSEADTEVLVLSHITFAREVEGVSVGFDLDDQATAAGSSAGCGVADAVDPDGNPGVDNAFARLLPALELTEGAALEQIVAEAIRSGGLLAMVELSRVDDLQDDTCLDVAVLGGLGVPMVGYDGEILPAQTFDRDPEVPATVVDGVRLTGGTLEVGPTPLDLPFAFLDARVVFHLESARMRLVREPDGRVHGMVAGGIAIATLSQLAHDTGIGAEVEDLLDGALGLMADLAPDATGACTQISVTLEFEALQAFFYDGPS